MNRQNTSDASEMARSIGIPKRIRGKDHDEIGKVLSCFSTSSRFKISSLSPLCNRGVNLYIFQNKSISERGRVAPVQLSESLRNGSERADCAI